MNEWCVCWWWKCCKSKKDVDSEKVQETKIPKISTVLDNLKCTESVRVNNTLDHIREVVIDASLSFSDTNPDVRTPVLNRPISLAGQNTGYEMDQWRRTL